MAGTSPKSITELDLDGDEFTRVLGDILGNVQNLQNSPPQHVPQESLTANLILKYLEPVTKPKGPLEIRKIEYVENRANLMIKFPAKNETEKCVAFLGSHMDVVPANPEEWDMNPFELTVQEEGNKLCGRGVTDCTGHVALFTVMLKQLVESGFVPDVNVHFVFIANEENSAVKGIGIDKLYEQGELDILKHGPVYWVDSADFGPTLGCAGMGCWELNVQGKKFHSGLPHKGINALECAMQAVGYLQEKFFEQFPKHEKEEEYRFVCSSSMKPTRIEVPPGGINQIPGGCTIKGDIRYLPFYKWEDIKGFMLEHGNNIPLGELKTYGLSRFELPDEDKKAEITFKFVDMVYKGMVVNLETEAYAKLESAMNKHHKGGAKPFSLTGSLPIIADLAELGYDLQIFGFGRMDAYHAINEYAYLDEFKEGFKITLDIIESFQTGTSAEN